MLRVNILFWLTSSRNYNNSYSLSRLSLVSNSTSFISKLEVINLLYHPKMQRTVSRILYISPKVNVHLQTKGWLKIEKEQLSKDSSRERTLIQMLMA